MSRTPELLTKRNEAVKKSFKEIKMKNPKWRFDALVDEVASKFFLSRITIIKILKDY